jgi:glycerol-3-phosphate dehydrogenase (NAD(P)+)
MSKIVILGAGAIGSAFSGVCADAGHKTTIVGTHLDDDFINKINKNNKIHPVLNFRISKKVKVVKFSNFFTEVRQSTILVIGVNSTGIDWVADQINFLDNFKGEIILLTKGISISKSGKLETLIDKLQNLLLNKKISISGIVGPCLARGLANKVHTSVVVVNKNLNKSKSLAKLFKTNYYHPTYSKDVKGVEILAAIKNIYAMAVGAVESMAKTKKNIKESNLHLNTQALLIPQCIKEMSFIVEKIKGDKNSVFGLAGLGDLYVSSLGGRNSKMGKYLGLGYKYQDAKKRFMPNDTVEAADLIFDIGKKLLSFLPSKKVPLMTSLIRSLLSNKKFNINWSTIHHA